MNNVKGPRFSRRQVTKRKFNIPTLDVDIRQNIQENHDEEKTSTPGKQSRFDPPEETPPPGEVSVSFLASTPKPGKSQWSRKRPISPVRENSELNSRSSRSHSQKSLSETAKSLNISSAVDTNNNSGSVKPKQSKTFFSKNPSDRNHLSPGSSIDEKMALLTKARLEKSRQSKERKLSEKMEQESSENAAVNDTTKSSLPENKSTRLENRSHFQKRQKASVSINNVEVNNTSSKKGKQITSEDREVSANMTRSFSRTSQRNNSITLRQSNSQSKPLVQSKAEDSSKTVLEKKRRDQTLNNRSLTYKKRIEKKVPESTNRIQEKSRNKEKILKKKREENRNARGRRTDESSENEESKKSDKSVNRVSATKKPSNRQNKSSNRTENSDDESSVSEKTDADNTEEETENMVTADKSGDLSDAGRKTAVNRTLQELSRSTEVTGEPNKDQKLLVWEKEGQKRSKKDVTDLDIVLNTVTDTLKSNIDVYGTDEEQSSLKVLQKYLTRDITQMITCTQTVLNLQTDIKRKEQRVKKIQKKLMSLQKERIEKEEKCEPLKRQQSSNEKMAAINQFLTDLSELIDMC